MPRADRGRRVDEYVLTVGRLMEELAGLPADMQVGVAGHYGEFYPMSVYDCTVQQPREHIGSQSTVAVFVLSPPDIGPEPD